MKQKNNFCSYHEKWFCRFIFLSQSKGKETIDITKYKNRLEAVKKYILRNKKKYRDDNPYAFYLYSKLIGKANGVELASKKMNISKTYFINARFVTKEELYEETRAEERAEPWTGDDARRAFKELNEGRCEKVFQSGITDYFFVFDQNKHELLN